jgi:hypothetical protein
MKVLLKGKGSVQFRLSPFDIIYEETQGTFKVFLESVVSDAVTDTVFMDRLQLTGQNLGRVFNFRSGHLQAVQF